MTDPFALRSRWWREASEGEIRRTMQDPLAEICEWPTSGLTFILSARELVILRTGALGGDVREIHGGWKYPDVFSCLKEWSEIRSLEPSFQRKPKGR